MEHFSNKLVAIVNKSLEPGRAMNTLAHMSLALGAIVGDESLQLVDYCDKDGNVYPSISKHPFIILRATGGKLKTLDEQVRNSEMIYITFTSAMIIGTWQEQLERSKNSPRAELDIYGVILYGPLDTVANLTKKFSLWK